MDFFSCKLPIIREAEQKKQIDNLNVKVRGLTINSNLAIARWLEATKRLNFRVSALLKDSFRRMYTLCCTDNKDAVPVTGEYEDPRTLVVLAMPISDNKLLIAASV